MGWLSESGELYHQWMENTEYDFPGDITALRFHYRAEDEAYPEDDDRRYGDWLVNNTIRTTCGRLTGEFVGNKMKLDKSEYCEAYADMLVLQGRATKINNRVDDIVCILRHQYDGAPDFMRAPVGEWYWDGNDPDCSLNWTCPDSKVLPLCIDSDTLFWQDGDGTAWELDQGIPIRWLFEDDEHIREQVKIGIQLYYQAECKKYDEEDNDREARVQARRDLIARLTPEERNLLNVR